MFKVWQHYRHENSSTPVWKDSSRSWQGMQIHSDDTDCQCLTLFIQIFVRYEAKEQALAALRALAGRKFADRTVVTSFVDEENYLADDF